MTGFRRLLIGRGHADYCARAFIAGERVAWPRTRNYPRGRQVYFQWNCAFDPHRAARKRRPGIMRTGRISTGLCGSSTDREIIYWSYANFTVGPHMAKSTKKDPTRACFCGRTNPVWKTVREYERGPGELRECSRILCASEVEFPNNETPRATRGPRWSFEGKRSLSYWEILVIRYVALRGFLISKWNFESNLLNLFIFQNKRHVFYSNLLSIVYCIILTVKV